MMVLVETTVPTITSPETENPQQSEYLEARPGDLKFKETTSNLQDSKVNGRHARTQRNYKSL